jgi:hypothetical protein
MQRSYSGCVGSQIVPVAQALPVPFAPASPRCQWFTVRDRCRCVAVHVFIATFIAPCPTSAAIAVGCVLSVDKTDNGLLMTADVDRVADAGETGAYPPLITVSGSSRAVASIPPDFDLQYETSEALYFKNDTTRGLDQASSVRWKRLDAAGQCVIVPTGSGPLASALLEASSRMLASSPPCNPCSNLAMWRRSSPT